MQHAERDAERIATAKSIINEEPIVDAPEKKTLLQKGDEALEKGVKAGAGAQAVSFPRRVAERALERGADASKNIVKTGYKKVTGAVEKVNSAEKLTDAGINLSKRTITMALKG